MLRSTHYLLVDESDKVYFWYRKNRWYVQFWVVQTAAEYRLGIKEGHRGRGGRWIVKPLSQSLYDKLGPQSQELLDTLSYDATLIPKAVLAKGKTNGHPVRRRRETSVVDGLHPAGIGSD